MSNQSGNSKDLVDASPAQRHAAQNTPQDTDFLVPRLWNRVKSFQPGRSLSSIPKELWSCSMCGKQAQIGDTLREIEITLEDGNVRRLRFVNACYGKWTGRVTPRSIVTLAKVT